MNWLYKFKERFLQDWFSLNSFAFFAVICLLYLAMFILKKMFILENIAAFEVLQDRGEMWVMNLFFALQNFSIPLFLAWKFTLTAFMLWVGCFLFGYRIYFRDLWKMVMIMELVFILPELFKIFYFMFWETDPTYHDYVAFYPLSLINFVDYTNVNPAFIYPLKSLNLFEVLYALMLTLGIFSLSGKKSNYALRIILISYVGVYLLWLVYYTIVYK